MMSNARKDENVSKSGSDVESEVRKEFPPFSYTSSMLDAITDSEHTCSKRLLEHEKSIFDSNKKPTLVRYKTTKQR